MTALGDSGAGRVRLSDLGNGKQMNRPRACDPCFPDNKFLNNIISRTALQIAQITGFNLTPIITPPTLRI